MADRTGKRIRALIDGGAGAEPERPREAGEPPPLASGPAALLVARLSDTLREDEQALALCLWAAEAVEALRLVAGTVRALAANAGAQPAAGAA